MLVKYFCHWIFYSIKDLRDFFRIVYWSLYAVVLANAMVWLYAMIRKCSQCLRFASKITITCSVLTQVSTSCPSFFLSYDYKKKKRQAEFNSNSVEIEISLDHSQLRENLSTINGSTTKYAHWIKFTRILVKCTILTISGTKYILCNEDKSQRHTDFYSNI